MRKFKLTLKEKGKSRFSAEATIEAETMDEAWEKAQRLSLLNQNVLKLVEVPNWEFIEEYHPIYSSSDLVLESDILQRFLDGEEVCSEDYLWIVQTFKHDNQSIQRRLDEILFKLYMEATVNYRAHKLAIS